MQEMRDMAGSIPGSGRSPGEGNGNPLQYSCLENSMNKGAWLSTVHGVPKNQTWLNTVQWQGIWSYFYRVHLAQFVMKSKSQLWWIVSYNTSSTQRQFIYTYIITLRVKKSKLSSNCCQYYIQLREILS